MKFDSVDQVGRFVDLIDRFDADLRMGSGRRIVDARSIMGVLTLDLSQPLTLKFDPDDPRIREGIAPFLVGQRTGICP